MVIYTVCYLTFKGEQPRQAKLSIRNDNKMKLWLNGQLLKEIQPGQNPEQNSGTLDLELRPGKNQLLLKIYKQGKQSRFSLRISDENGDFFKEVKFEDPMRWTAPPETSLNHKWEPTPTSTEGS